MNLGTAQIIQGNALNLPLPDASVDLICTSPPYFGLRSYQDGCPDCANNSKANMRGYMERYCPDCGKVGTVQVCPSCGLTTLRTEETKAALRKQTVDPNCTTCGGTGKGHYEGQIGSEATPAEFLDALLAATREMMRVLKPSGSIFVNLGDKYAMDSKWGGKSGIRHPADSDGDHAYRGRRRTGIRDKSLMGIPWRYAIRCIDELGLILRAEIIWNKPNGLPESVTDRVRRSHENWFHFTRSPRYFSAVDEIREPGQNGNATAPRKQTEKYGAAFTETRLAETRFAAAERSTHPLGKLPGSVWTTNEGESLIRSVLRAVSEGGITVDEGERILAWSTPYGFGRTQKQAKAAGTGQDSSTATATADTTASHSAQHAPTASPTNSPTAPSQTASQSTTFAETNDASTLNTSNQSASISTLHVDHESLTASEGISTTKPTPMFELAEDESVEHVCGTKCVNGEHWSGPPSIWEVATQPLTVPPELGVDHFAAYPMEWPRRIIQGWTPNGVCTSCGEGRRPISDSEYLSGTDRPGIESAASGRHRTHKRMGDGIVVNITGYVCGCPTPNAPTTPAVVLDPFGGTGTTALVAKALGRVGITIDLSSDYCRLAEWRCNDPGQLAAALQVEKPDLVPDDQLNLFEDNL